MHTANQKARISNSPSGSRDFRQRSTGKGNIIPLSYDVLAFYLMSGGAAPSHPCKMCVPLVSMVRHLRAAGKETMRCLLGLGNICPMAVGRAVVLAIGSPSPLHMQTGSSACVLW